MTDPTTVVDEVIAAENAALKAQLDQTDTLLTRQANETAQAKEEIQRLENLLDDREKRLAALKAVPEDVAEAVDVVRRHAHGLQIEGGHREANLLLDALDTIIAALNTQDEELRALRERAERAERLNRIHELQKMPCVCGGSWSANRSTVTTCRRCQELRELDRATRTATCPRPEESE